MNYIHIGLGKTGTSALQRGIFQVLKDNNYIRDYNHEEIVRLSRKYIDISLTSEEKETLLNYASNMNQDLISFEGLVHWNPVKWEEAADKSPFSTFLYFTRNFLVQIDLMHFEYSSTCVFGEQNTK